MTCTAPAQLAKQVAVWYHEGSFNRTKVFDPPQVARGSADVGDYGDSLIWFSAPEIYASPMRFPFRAQPAALDAYELAMCELLQDGYCPLLVDAYRTIKQQEALQRRKPGIAVSPSSSKHTRGTAFDVVLWDDAMEADWWDSLNRSTWGDQEHLAEVFAKHNLVRTNPRESWHFEHRS